MDTVRLVPAALAFDAIAGTFDERFEGWLSVAAQRRAVRAALLRAFPRGARLVEIGGGTGLDAQWLIERGRALLLTDAAPAMVRAASLRLGEGKARVASAERLEALAAELEAEGAAGFDGAFSNFAALNCVADLAPVARGLARLVLPGGRVLLVLFGTASPGEMIVEAARGRFRNVLRRRSRGAAPAKLGGREFTIHYHRASDIRRAMRPWFRPVRRTAIGLFVPPSAAEPWISRHPRLLRGLESLDRVLARPLAALGDHVLYEFERLPVAVGN